MTETPAQLHLVLGEEELLVERAVAGIVAVVRMVVSDPHELPVDRLRTGDMSATELAELLSPSLFAEDRVVVLESAAEAGKDAVELVQDAAAAPPEGVVLVILHSGGGRAKTLVPALKKLGAQVHDCTKLKGFERVRFVSGFVRGEFRTAGVRVSPEVIEAVVEAVGSDLRELAAACAQLVADTGGRVDVAAVRRYYSGKAEVTGFDIAEYAVSGDRSAALEALRWATFRGVAPVLLADALADSVNAIARVGSAGRGDPSGLAPQLGMPPWKVKKVQAQARGWSAASIGAAMQVVAQLNADVKGAAVSAEYALERAVDRIVALRAQR